MPILLRPYDGLRRDVGPLAAVLGQAAVQQLPQAQPLELQDQLAARGHQGKYHIWFSHDKSPERAAVQLIGIDST